MRNVVLGILILIWMVFATLHQDSGEKKSGSWFDEISTAFRRLPPVAPPAAAPPPVASTQAPVNASAEPRLVCRKPGNPERSLVITARGGGCELVYVKPESSQRVAWSQKSTQPCEQVRERISFKLEAAGFTCGESG